MILTLIIHLISVMLTSLFDILPNVPAMPVAVTSAGDWLINLIHAMMGPVTMIFSQAILIVVIPLIIIMINFEWSYYALFYIVKKLPFVNIK